ncbi:MAG: hypothetical protein R3F62_15555 [Planctomycetota bacterium]
MSSKPASLLRACLVALALTLTGSAFAQDAAPKDAARKDEAARRAQLLERYRKLDPEKREELLEVYRKRIKKLDQQDSRRLRKLARGKLRHEGGGHGRLRHREGKGEAKREFMQRFVHRLSESDRQRLANLEPEERRDALRQLLGAHRQRNLQRDFKLLPRDRQRELEGEVDGLDPRERFRRVRSALDEHLRARLREVMTSDASPDEKRAQLAELFKELPEPMRKRFEEQLERRLGAGGERPVRPGGGPVPRGPRGPRRQGGQGGRGQR